MNADSSGIRAATSAPARYQPVKLVDREQMAQVMGTGRAPAPAGNAGERQQLGEHRVDTAAGQPGPGR